MSAVTLHRRDLEALSACAAGLALFDQIASLQGDPTRIHVPEWTHLHAMWIRVEYPRFAMWWMCAGLIPRANLTCANLMRANLTGADLTGADLRAANLTGANLTGANLTCANLEGAALTGANLKGAYLTGADFTGADLTGANLTGAYRGNSQSIPCWHTQENGRLVRACKRLHDDIQ